MKSTRSLHNGHTGRASRSLLLILCLWLAPGLPAFAEEERSPLRFGLTPVILDDRLTYLARLRDYLQTEVDRPVELVQRGSYREILELLENDELDAAWICGYPYVKHRKNLDLVAIPRYRGEPLYRSYLIARSDNRAIQGWDDLAGRVFAYSDPDSNSGYLYPRHALDERGHTPSEFLGHTFFTGSHQAVVEAVAAGLAEAGAVDGYVWETLREIKPDLVAQTRIIARSPTFGFPPIVAGSTLSKEQRLRLRDGLMEMALDPEGEQLLEALNLDGFSEPEPGLYDDIETMMRDIRKDPMSRHLSYRYRVPLSLAGVILLTALVLGSVHYYQQAASFHEDLLAKATTNRDNLAPTLVPAIRHNDVWQAYRSLEAAAESGAPPHPVIILVDHRSDIFAASHPQDYRVGAPLDLATEHLSQVAGALEAGAFERILEGVVPDHRVVIAPLEAPDAVAGHLVFLYENTRFTERVTASAWRTFTSTAAVLALILPIGWLWGRRITEPLTRLSDCMTQVAHDGPKSLDCALEQRNDEIGELTQRFQEMVHDLREKAELERDMVASERLAAVGRLAAGIAHEINNPLGGMLMTLDTLKSRGELDPNARRSVDLIERGLHQIQETVAALLFEAQRSSRHLLPEDLDDVRRLMTAQLQEGRLCLRWENHLETSAAQGLPIPATLTRQVLINLLLNAIEATPIGGLIIAEFECRDDTFRVRVTNEGEPMPAEVRDNLFAPLHSRKPGGRGLGLWVTQQLVDQMNGTITVTSDEAFTTFLVTLPLSEADHDDHD